MKFLPNNVLPDLEVTLKSKLSPGTIAKMGKGERVKMEIAELICDYLQMRPAENIDYEPKKFVSRKDR